MSGFYEYHASDVVPLRLADFEGSLDLLCTLIREQKLDIMTCRISDVTNQYLEYMEQLDTVDMDLATDFMLMAATLLQLKSRALLPQEEEYTEEEEDYNPEEELRRQVIIYNLFKEQADKMAMIEVLNQYYREPMYTDEDADIVIKSFDRNKLIEAYGHILLSMTKEEQQMAVKKIKKDKFTVSEKIALISTVLQEKKEIKFSDLYKKDASKTEIITTFQAMLELMKKQYLTATQESFYEDIVLTLNDAEDGKEIDLAELTKTEDKYDD